MKQTVLIVNSSQNKKQWLSLLFLFVFFMPLLLMWVPVADAKKLKIRSCTLSNGETVLMDKACPKNSATSEYKKPTKNKTQSSPRQRRWHQQSAQNKNKAKISSYNSIKNKAQSRNRVSASNHNPNLSLPLRRLLANVKAPGNWFVQSFTVPKGDVITASPKRLMRPNALKTGAIIHRYANTVKHFKKDAFSVAIDMFHEIRFDEQNELTESEFIKHSKFKVFNVHYRKKRLRQSTIKVVAQFYVDEKNDDLYVVQFLAPSQHWQRMSVSRKQFFQSLAL